MKNRKGQEYIRASPDGKTFDEVLIMDSDPCNVIGDRSEAQTVHDTCGTDTREFIEPHDVNLDNNPVRDKYGWLWIRR